MPKLFGTDGVRGVAGKELSAELALSIGQAAAVVLTKHLPAGKKPKLIIGKDTRRSCDMLESALAAGICSVGADAVLLGVLPTPAVAHLVTQYEADAGIMISASHNPFEFNGIKLFNSEGFKLPDSIEEEIEALIESGAATSTPSSGGEIGSVCVQSGAAEDYIKHIVFSAGGEGIARGLRIVLDCACGSSSATARQLFSALGAETVVLSDNPDGVNINENCGSTHMEAVAAAVKGGGFDLGLAFDGDADRCLAVDSEGGEIDGDRIIAVLANYLKEKDLLKEDTAVVTVMSNLGFFEFADNFGINALATKVGDRYVLEKMLEGGYSLGGEQSGHVIMLDHATTGDGQLTGAFLLKIIAETGKSFSELASVMETYPQVIKNVKVENHLKSVLETDKEVKEVIAECSETLKKSGRVLVRASGTEPLIRVMLEGKNKEQIEELAEKIAAKIREKTLS